MTDTDHETPSKRSVLFPIMLTVVAVVFLVFAPLLASIVEHVVFKTHKVEEFFRQIGLFELLDRIYSPVVNLIRK